MSLFSCASTVTSCNGGVLGTSTLELRGAEKLPRFQIRSNERRRTPRTWLATGSSTSPVLLSGCDFSYHTVDAESRYESGRSDRALQTRGPRNPRSGCPADRPVRHFPYEVVVHAEVAVDRFAGRSFGAWKSSAKQPRKYRTSFGSGIRGSSGVRWRACAIVGAKAEEVDDLREVHDLRLDLVQLPADDRHF
jgi:hypothetical protein